MCDKKLEKVSQKTLVYSKEDYLSRSLLASNLCILLDLIYMTILFYGFFVLLFGFQNCSWGWLFSSGQSIFQQHRNNLVVRCCGMFYILILKHFLQSLNRILLQTNQCKFLANGYFYCLCSSYIHTWSLFFGGIIRPAYNDIDSIYLFIWWKYDWVSVFFLFLLSFCGQGTIFNTFTVGRYSLSFHSLLFLKHSISILEKY